MWPLAFMMGVPQEDCLKVGLLIGHLEFLTHGFFLGVFTDCPMGIGISTFSLA